VIVTVGVAEVPAGKPLAIRVSDTLTLAVCELDGAYHAFDEKCPHRAAALTQGEITGELIVCPVHHFKFNLKTGRCVMPKHLRLRSFPVTREGDRLTIELKDAAAPAAADTAPPGMPGPAG
jgi:nitrite reductase/ring-hydroxylating ferredoxin subunit